MSWLERSWWPGFNEIYLVRFGFRMWEILILNWFLPLKIQINFKNPGFERKISWELGNTWANDTGHTSIFYMAITSIVSCAKLLARTLFPTILSYPKTTVWYWKYSVQASLLLHGGDSVRVDASKPSMRYYRNCPSPKSKCLWH